MPKTQLLCLLVAVSILHTFWPPPLEAHVPYTQQGVASWYGQAFAGRPTASGTPFSPRDMTAAHRTLPLGTKVLVHNLETGERTEVKITDRGPYAEPQRRIIDVSRAAAMRLGVLDRGLGRVQVAVTEPAATVQASKEVLVYVVQVGAFAEYAGAQGVLAQLQDCYGGPIWRHARAPQGAITASGWVRLPPPRTRRRSPTSCKGTGMPFLWMRYLPSLVQTSPSFPLHNQWC
jgi:hypothetical protein